ncbi:beta-N-acetylglucosaminidase domain-containing protein [Cellulomonas sp. PS-H5]|uniref:beta-N-acetylglucosaminidase domain-containing protein n=1 Tax=Cellulomonas sp. PS-H5 TaxID=2820400 RepID=UPI001C500D71|nr:beta-N-acetylglucosaminidase domain-containing protein [Cellulomonas sp. PS-H5]MBW0253112.1 beta-N-acetylglucosaminidase domain-containing protein [Cellulomonas sp. PS-H5]
MPRRRRPHEPARPATDPGLPRPAGRLSAGVVEGFYGPPWRHDERLALLDAAPGLGLDTYLYAPKDDPWHRERWREPYPDAELARLGELAARAAAAGVAFVWSVAPGLSMRFSDDVEHAALAAKAEQVRAAGVRDVWLLFDDVPYDLPHPEDVAAFGPGQAGSGRAHGEAAARFREAFLLPHGLTGPMTVCPTDYAGCGRSPYRDALGSALPADARVLWTGRDIVVGEVTQEDVLAAAEAFGRRIVLWDNVPVNDFDRSRLFLGPLTGRPDDVDGLPLDGTVANAMIEALPSRLPLATVGAWARDPSAYDPARAAADALALVAGPRAGVVGPLVRACAAWPPGAPRDPGLARATTAALAGDAGALAEVEGRMRALEGCAADATGAGEDAEADALVAALRPWLDAAAHAGAAGLAACALLRGAGVPAAARAALDVVETDFPDVLRADVAGFVRAALAGRVPGGERGEHAPGAEPPLGTDRARPGDAGAGPGRRAVLVTGAEPSAGDEATARWLRSRGLDVRTASTWPPADDAGVDLVALTPDAPAAAAETLAGVAVPVLAWGRLVSLGVGTTSGVLLDRDRLVRADGCEVVVHRGAGRLTWCEPVPGARVLARAPEPEPLPVLVEVPAATPLATGTLAPAARTVAFLTDDGAARWLLTDAGRSLLDEALARLLLPAPPPAAVLVP